MMSRRWCHAQDLLLTLVVGLLPACASYHPQPLPTTTGLLNDLTMVRLPDDATMRVNFGDGIDPNEAAVLAVFDNPSLRAMRLRAGVADAQLFAAGLFPDPQITLGFDNPTSSAPDLSHALALGIGIDTAAMVTHGSGHKSAAAAAQQARLDVLWQEWQVAQQARILASRYAAETEKIVYLEASQRAFHAQSRAAVQALQAGDLTVDVAATDVSALLDVTSTLYQVRMTHSDTAHALNALLGLDSQVALEMTRGRAPQQWPSVDMAAVAAQRPDLLALQAGYRSQEARVRQAVWSQFPLVSLTWNRLRDTSDIWSSGLSAVLNLPLFSGARGDIAVQRATRAALSAEYQDRLAQSQADIDRLLADAALQQSHADTLRDQLPGLTTMVEQAEHGAGAGDLAAVIATGLRAGLVTKQLELIDVEQALWETRVALDTLLGRVAP